jgi:hypothetical protein
MRLRVLILLSLFLVNVVSAEPTNTGVQTISVPPITQAQNIAFENCTKMFAINKEKLFYLTLSAVTANKFSIDEIQTQNGYIIFSVTNNKYLATIAGIDNDNSVLRITPCNNVYHFPPGIYVNMFKYIDINLNAKI